MTAVDLLKEFESLVAAEKAEATRLANSRFHSIIAERAASRTALSGATIHQLAKVASEEVERFGDTIIKLAEQFAAQLKLDSSSTLEVVRRASAQLPLSLIELEVIKNLEEKMGKPSVKLNMLRLMDPSRERLKSKLSKLQLGIRDLGGAPVQNFYNHVSAGTIQAGSLQVGQ
ncbi:MAG: hypothetical protein Q8S09_12260, partial [Hyphomonas sp.]|nr:hypothetical protein [Hyphomonas sp.]